MVILYITRHGQTEWNLEKRMQGWLDSPLTIEGKEAAVALGERLAQVPFKACFASPSGRTVETAQLICKNRSLPLLLADELKEIHAGDWQGLTADAIEKQFPRAYHAYYHDTENFQSQGGENFHQVLERALCAIKTMQDTYAEDDAILLVTHAVVKKLIICHFKNLPVQRVWDPPFIHGTSLTKIHLKKNGEATLELIGDTQHLKNTQ